MTQPLFTILVPIFEETEALRFSRFYFGRLGLTPVYALDSKKLARRAEVEAILGGPVAIYENDTTFLEGRYERLAALAPTDWILRIDCDEVPTQELISYCHKVVKGWRRGIVLFDRRELRINQGAVEEIDWPAYADAQWRFFNRKRVIFDHQLHTPGIILPKSGFGRIKAPPKAKILHLDFLFHAQAQRLAKSARYQQVGQAESRTTFYAMTAEDHSWRPAHETFFSETYRLWLKSEAG